MSQTSSRFTFLTLSLILLSISAHILGNSLAYENCYGTREKKTIQSYLNERYEAIYSHLGNKLKLSVIKVRENDNSIIVRYRLTALENAYVFIYPKKSADYESLMGVLMINEKLYIIREKEWQTSFDNILHEKTPNWKMLFLSTGTKKTFTIVIKKPIIQHSVYFSFCPEIIRKKPSSAFLVLGYIPQEFNKNLTVKKSEVNFSTIFEQIRKKFPEFTYKYWKENLQKYVIAEIPLKK